MSKTPFGLGRGLDALIPSKKAAQRVVSEPVSTTTPSVQIVSPAVRSAPVEPPSSIPTDGYMVIPVDSIVPNPRQPRTRFDPEELESLADSIVQYGLLQPIVVTRLDNGGYELVSGERRLRAAKIAGLERIPAVVRSSHDQEKLELALIENIQRSDLDPIERAQSYQILINEFALTQEQASKRLGVARSIIANTLRYLQLPLKAQDALREGKITEGHAKILASLETEEQQKSVLETILEQHYTVREAETLVKTRKRSPRSSSGVLSLPTLPNAQHEEMLRELRTILATKVEIHPQGEGGRVVIYYYAPEELYQIVDKITLAGS